MKVKVIQIGTKLQRSEMFIITNFERNWSADIQTQTNIKGFYYIISVGFSPFKTDKMIKWVGDNIKPMHLKNTQNPI